MTNSTAARRERAKWAEADDAKKALVEKAVNGIIRHARQMERECKHKPCVHAQGLMLAVSLVRDAAKCRHCGSDPGGHMGGCKVWDRP